MIRDSLQQIVASAVANLVQSGQLPEAVRDVRIEITDTKQPEHGDFACNFALTASKAAGMNPRHLGEMLAAGIRETGKEVIREIEIAGPGFLNLRLNPEWVASYLPEILERGDKLGYAQPTANRQPLAINVEFVSVNPNGPITIGSGRGAAYGSTLCNVLEAAGNKVHREYYINDGVNSEQMRLFAMSVAFACRTILYSPREDRARMANSKDEVFFEDFLQGLGPGLGGNSVDYFSQELLAFYSRKIESGAPWEVDLATLFQQSHTPGDEHVAHLKRCYSLCYSDGSYRSMETLFPANGYKGDYVTDVAHMVLSQFGDEEVTKHLFEEPPAWFQEHSEKIMLSAQLSALLAFGTTFDTWFSEQSLHNSGEVAKEMEQMVASQVADDREVRTVLKLAKGGVIEDVDLQPQTGKAEVDDDHGAEPGTADLQIGEQAGTQLHATADTTDSGADLEIGGPSEPSNQATEQPSNSKTLWLRSAKFGDDMDRVLKRRDGRLTYIASDVAYHKDKLTDASGTRGTGPVDKMITVLGPDHHGYIGRLQAVVAAMLKAEGLLAEEARSGGAEEQPLSELEAKIYSTPEERDLCKAALAEAKRKLEVQIFQLVRFVKDGKPAPMRKRDGNIYALIDLMREIGENVKPNGTEEEKLEAGKDVSRFFYLMRSHDTTFDFDLDLAQKQSDENPVFYVQYAHARICSVIGKAAESGLTALRQNGVTDGPSENPQSRNAETPSYALLTHDRELTLIKKICDLPFEVQRCAEDYGVHRLTTYAIELARTYHHFYDACRVIQPEEPELSRARLALCEATRLALKGTLDLLGISAPNRMERAEAPAATS